MTNRAGRTLALALMASLSINLFLAGMLVSHWLFRPPPPHPHGPPPDGGPFDRRAARAALPPEHRAIVDGIWQDREPILRARLDAVRGAQDAVRTAMLQEPFEQATLNMAHEALTQCIVAARQAMEEALATIAASLPPDARHRYFEASIRRRPPPPPRHHGPPMQPPPM